MAGMATGSSFGEVLDGLGAQHRELATLLDGLDAAGWAAPAPRCPGWTVREVVLHLAQTDELAIGSAEGRFEEVLARLSEGVEGATSVDDGAAKMVDADRGLTPTQVHQRWLAASGGLREVLRAADPHQRVEWIAGTLSVHTLATTRLAECWIHTGDVADAVGAVLEHGDRLRHIARLAWRTLPHAFSQAGCELSGPVTFELRGPSGQSWRLQPEGATPGSPTTITGDAHELCLVAARRVDPAATSLTGTGPDARAVLELVRTYA